MEFSPAGKVPVLVDGPVTVWDSLAIIEYVTEVHLAGKLPPGDPATRAYMRAVSAEMHSGFSAVRAELPVNIRRRIQLDPDLLSADCHQEIQRIIAIWTNCRTRHEKQGPWLLGAAPTMADAMYLPVALRFQTYGIAPAGRAAEWMAMINEDPVTRLWCTEAEREPWELDFIDNLYK